MSKKYYWLKLSLDFFEREEIRVIESMPNGKEYVLFYMKLLLKTANSDGLLILKGIMPYTPEIIAKLTNTDIDIVRSAVKIFLQFGMMQRLEDKTLYMNEIQSMLGCETEYARKKREYREKKKLELLNYAEDDFKTTEDKEQDKTEDVQEDNTKTEKDNVRQEIEYRDKSIEKDIEKDIEREKEEDEKDTFLAQLSKMAYVEKLKTLKGIIMKVTGKDENSVNLIFRPAYYTDVIDDVLIAIRKSRYLSGKLEDRKPNLNTFTVKAQIDRILAGAYEDFKTKEKATATIDGLRHKGATADDLMKEIGL